jgi:hypothetical protein
MVVGKRLTLRPKKAKVEFAFLVILSMWLSQLKLLWIFSPNDVPHSVQPCWYTSGTPPQPHFPSNQRPFTTIPGTTHKNYSVQDIILLTSHTPLEPTTRKCGGIRHPRQIPVSSLTGKALLIHKHMPVNQYSILILLLLLLPGIVHNQ